MDRRRFVHLTGASGAALALSPRHLFPGSELLAGVSSTAARAALAALRGDVGTKTFGIQSPHSSKPQEIASSLRDTSLRSSQ